MVNEATDAGEPASLDAREFAAGPDQSIVVYIPPDIGVEVDPDGIMASVAADAAIRAGQGWHIASLDSMNLRHSGLFVGRQGSGFESKVAIVVVYRRA